MSKRTYTPGEIRHSTFSAMPGGTAQKVLEAIADRDQKIGSSLNKRHSFSNWENGQCAGTITCAARHNQEIQLTLKLGVKEGIFLDDQNSSSRSLDWSLKPQSLSNDLVTLHIGHKLTDSAIIRKIANGLMTYVTLGYNWINQHGEIVPYPWGCSSAAERKAMGYQGRKGSAELCAIRERMNKVGIGYSGIPGVSWRMATKPFVLPQYVKEQIDDLGQSLFALYDLFETMEWFSDALQMLDWKAPTRLTSINEKGSCSIFRPDLAITRDQNGQHDLKLQLTENETAPAGFGMLHALQVGYQLPLTSQHALAALLRYRDSLTVFSTYQWSEYIWDLGVMVKSLRDLGIDANLVFDRTLDEVQRHSTKSWYVPINAPQEVKQQWNNNISQRLKMGGMDKYVHGIDTGTIGQRVYRFGYLDNLRDNLSQLAQWQREGKKIINPLQYYLESKVALATTQSDYIRQKLNRRYLRTLEEVITPTHILDPVFTHMEPILNNPKDFITKFAAWDGDNQSWGSRSLTVGREVSAEQWRKTIADAQEAPFPIVAQRYVDSVRFDVEFFDHDGMVKTMVGARARLTPFFVRDDEGNVHHAGSMMTLRADTNRVHGSVDCIMAHAVFSD